jgi:hypothetical protein
MPTETRDRVVYIDQYGDVQCASSKLIAAIPSEFAEALTALTADLELALDCLRIFHGVPIPVAKAILRNIEPAQAAIDMAVRCSSSAERLVC